jgi:hypothetical protein
MWAANKRWLCYSLLALLLAFVLAAPQAEEEPGPWFLISEGELRSIEEYRETSERERQSWLSQARELRTRAGNSETRSAKLEAASETLNRRLARAREDQRRLELSFNGLEAEWLTRLSLKNGEIAALRRALADQEAETAALKAKAALRLAAIIALGAAIAAYAAFRLARLLRLIPL